MILLAAAALVTQTTPPPEVMAVRQARAMVTIISSAKLRFAEIEESHPKLFRQSTIRVAGGAKQIVRLVEFQ